MAYLSTDNIFFNISRTKSIAVITSNVCCAMTGLSRLIQRSGIWVECH